MDQETTTEPKKVTGRTYPNSVDGTTSNANERKDMQDKADFKDLSNQKKIKAANEKKLTQECSTTIQKLLDHEGERTSINDNMNALRSDLQSKGISKKALAIVMQISKMDEKQMDGFDSAYRILRNSIDKPIQDDLFPDSKAKH